MDIESTFGTGRPVVGVVHLPPLPGAPRFDGDREAVHERALADARALAAGGADGLIVENYGDVPFYPDDVPAHVVAEMTAVAAEIDAGLPVGVNVLRNDAAAALSVAHAAGGAFVRANVHTGIQATDQGLVEGQAHDTLRLRDRLDADVAILADVAVKHAAPLAARPLRAAVRETVERGLADGVIVSGPATGEPADTADLRTAADACADLDVPLFVGSGVTADNASELLAVADGAIVGTALKAGGETAGPVDERRVRRVVAAVEE